MKDEDQSGSSPEASERPSKASRKSREDEAEGSSTKSNKKAKSEISLPKSFDSFNENKDSITIQLVVKDSKGEMIHISNFEKKQFGTGSFGWSLTDKVTVDNGEGGKMVVSLNGNCE